MGISLIRTKVEAGNVAIHWIGQGGFVLKGHVGPTIYIDPYLSDSCNADGNCARLVEIPIKPKDVQLELLCLTHDHTDHTDPLTVPHILQQNPNAKVICPPASTRHLIKLGAKPHQITTVTPGEQVQCDGVTVHVVAAEHSEDSVGFVFAFDSGIQDEEGPHVYITGDTEYNDGLSSSVQDLEPDVLLVPINGRLGNMNAESAAKLTSEILPIEVIPMHFGMFESNTEDPAVFVRHLGETLTNGQTVKPIIMRHNSTHIFSGGDDAHGRKAHKLQRAERARKARASHEHHRGGHGPTSIR